MAENSAKANTEGIFGPGNILNLKPNPLYYDDMLLFRLQ